MINLLLFIVALTCFGMAAAWLAQNPGDVTIYWFDWRIDTSMAFLLAATLAAGAIAAIFYLLIRAIIKGPGNLSAHSQLKAHRKGITELTYSVASLAAADTRNAQLHTKKAEKLLGKTPITLLLSAQIARQQGDDNQTRQMLEQLLEHKETEYLAARSLSEAAGAQKLLPRALTLAKRAQSINPKEAAAVRSMLSLQIKLKQWDEALHTIGKHARKSTLGKDEIKRLEGLVYFEHAHALQATDDAHAALIHSKKSLKFLPDFVPAIVLTADCYNGAGQKEKAIKLLKKTWKKHQHPHIAETLKELTASNTKKYAKLLENISQHRGAATPLYQCSNCGHSQPHFSVHCPSCDAFDTQV